MNFPLQYFPTKSEIIHDSLGPLIVIEEEEQKEDNWIRKKEINEDIFYAISCDMALRKQFEVSSIC